MYQTPRMLRKRTTDKSPPEQKRRRTDDVNTAYQERRPTTQVYNHHKREAEGAPSHQPAPKRHRSTAHWDEQHSSGAQGNLRSKRAYEDISEHVATDTPHKKIRRTQRLRTRPYPRPTNWFHDPTQDGDTEPNPGPTAPTRVDQATQTTPPGDMGIEAHDALSPPLRATPLSQQPDDNIATKTGNADASEQVQEDCPLCLDRRADTSLSCDPKHRLCRTCANDPRLLRCPLCRSMLEPKVPPPPLDDPTYAYFYIQIYNNRLLTYTDYTATPNPPLPLAYNVWRQLTSTTGQLWEIHLRNDLPYYHIARHRSHVLTDTRDGFQMAIFIRYWPFLAHPLQHDLLLEYDITDRVPADRPLHIPLSTT